ncbi:MAG TPA: CusA/CzcA family heavy metal efflux RND transporter [Polyangiaceae bacterium]|jgi:cobalt-zinc-cadmium resistance protein CzcA
MIQRLVALAVRLPFIVICTAALIVIGGLYAYRQLNIEAYPNPVPPMVEIVTQPEGWSAEEVERYVTVPLEIGFAGMPALDHVRSQSLFGLSDIKCYFTWSIAYREARQEVINRMQFVQLPASMQPMLSPWNAIGELFRYRVVGKGYSIKDLKTAEDWILERQFKQVPGVIDVVSFGGETKQYHVGVDPYRMRAYGVTLDALVKALQNANQNVGGQRLVMGEQAYAVRGVGLLRDEHDIEDVVIAETHGVPVRVKDIGNVDVGFAPRLGIVGRDDDPDIVQGVVLMRYGGETVSTLKGIHQRIDFIEHNNVLPPGMHIEPYYDRGELVELTTHTVLENLMVGMGLVSLVLFLFLGQGVAALITAINIPIALLIAFSGMVATGTSANLISLGAIDFGIVVDSTVIMMENIFRHLGAHGRGNMVERILGAAREVATPMAFAATIIAAAFIPLFTMTGVAGVIFAPLATTYAFAIGGAMTMALTLTPVLASKLIPAHSAEKDSLVMRAMYRVYTPLFSWTLANPIKAIAIGVIAAAGGLATFPFLGTEFMPKLEEGNFWIRATLPTSISLEQSEKYVGRMRSILRGCPPAPAECTDKNRKIPEVLTVVSQLGRPDDGTDVAGFQNIELFAPLKPFSQWRRGLTKEKLTDALSKELSDAFPGVVFNFSQMISDNVEEAVSGVKGENSIKVFGPDIKENEEHADQIVDVLSSVRGIEDLGTFKSMGQPIVKITPDRRACARYGLNTGDVEAVIQAAIGGQTATQVYEGEKRFDLVVRWQEPFRSGIEAVREITVNTPGGQYIPLGQIADIHIEDGPNVVYREDGQRFAPITFSVRGRDLGGVIAEAKQRVAERVKLPYDTHLEWGGEINQLEEALSRLKLVVPLTLLLVAFLVYGATRHWLDTLIVFSNIPVACAGGLLSLFINGVHFSVSAAMGFVSIFGIATQDAILVVTYFKRLRRVEGLSVEDAAREAAVKRLRPVLMTTFVSTGLLPAAVATGIGSQTQKPLAMVVIGGCAILAVVARVVQPPILLLAHRWLDRRSHAETAGTFDMPVEPPHDPEQGS